MYIPLQYATHELKYFLKTYCGNPADLSSKLHISQEPCWYHPAQMWDSAGTVQYSLQSFMVEWFVCDSALSHTHKLD